MGGNDVEGVEGVFGKGIVVVMNVKETVACMIHGFILYHLIARDRYYY